MNLFDEQPDGDPHGECAAEIRRLEARIAELEAKLAAAGKLRDAAMDYAIATTDGYKLNLLTVIAAFDRETKPESLSSTALGVPTPVTDAAPACEHNQVIKECAAVCARFVSAWNQTSIDRLQAGRSNDSLLWAGKADGASLCHDTIMGLVANCSNEDTRTTGESDRTSDERMKKGE